MQKYNDPAGGVESTIDGPGSTQMNTFYWQRRALVEAAKEMYFTQQADVTKMPKHFGKKIKLHHYMPLLDDRNVNDQGIDANGVTIANGNLYGSSKDVGRVEETLPLLSETGGRVNRVGFTRLELEGTFLKFGMFTEFTQDMMDFDSDSELYGHISRELVTGASQLSEAVLQKDLLAGAGVIVFAGEATNTGEITGEGDMVSEVTYANLSRLNRILNDNRTPKQTKLISGSKMTDTKTIRGGRVIYIGSELEATIEGMTDQFGNPAFIPVNQYAAAGNIMHGEIGSVGHFRFIVVPEMLHWAGAGATETEANPGYMATDGRYDVFPMLCIGEGSFTTIGFQTGGKMLKFKMITKMPGEKTADRTDPFGETGFSSIKWFYGTMILRSERLALIKTVARI